MQEPASPNREGGAPDRDRPAPGPPEGLAVWGGRPVLREGVIGGLLGAGILALWFLIVDIAFRQAFFTPSALGSMVFLGAEGPEEVVISPGIVLGYTVIHVAAFLLVGVALAGIVTGIEANPGVLSAVVILFAVLAVVFSAMVTVLGWWILDELAVWSVLVGNLLAAVLMVGYLWRRHPALQEELRSASVREP